MIIIQINHLISKTTPAVIFGSSGPRAPIRLEPNEGDGQRRSRKRSSDTCLIILISSIIL